MSKFQNDAIFWVDVDKIDPNPYQPRRDFNEDGLRDLAESIRQYGVLQPLTVTRNEETKPDGGLKVYYELIAGERRLRAAKMANLSQVPVTIRDEKEDAEVKLELAIIENLQREDLNPIERAEAFNQLSDEFDFTHKEIAEKIGKSREYVSNSMRLLKLPEKIKQAVMSGKIAEGHARPVLMLRDNPEKQEQLFKEIIHQDLTVREAEKRARRDAQDKVRKKENKIDPETKALEDELSDTLGTRVQIEKKDKGGKLVIDFFSDEDLQSLIEMVKNSDDASVDEVMKEYAKAIDSDAGAEGENEADNPAQASTKDTEEPAETKTADDQKKQESAASADKKNLSTDTAEDKSMAETLGTMIQQAREQKEADKASTQESSDDTKESAQKESATSSGSDTEHATANHGVNSNQQPSANQTSDQEDTDLAPNADSSQSERAEDTTTDDLSENGSQTVEESQSTSAEDGFGKAESEEITNSGEGESVENTQEDNNKLQTDTDDITASKDSTETGEQAASESKAKKAVANSSTAVDNKQSSARTAKQNAQSIQPNQSTEDEGGPEKESEQESQVSGGGAQEPVRKGGQNKSAQDTESDKKENIQNTEAEGDDSADSEDEDDMYSVSNFSI